MTTPTPKPDATVASTQDGIVGGVNPLFLVVVGDGVFATSALPAQGLAVIGRAADSDVRIDDISISRNHAVLHLGTTLQVSDTDSANGTWVRDERIPPNTPTEIKINEAIRVGAVTVIVQRRAQKLRTRRLRTHGYFENRLEDECARAARHGSHFVLVHIVLDLGRSPAPTVTSLDDTPPATDRRRGRSKTDHDATPCPQEADVLELLVGVLREGDVVAEYAPGEIEILLLDAAPELMARVIRRLEAALISHHIDAQIGSSWYPRDGREPSTLAARVRARAHGTATEPTLEVGAIVVADERMTALHELVARVAAADISVLLQGETGVGKEVIADRIHRLSSRASKPFLRLNCAALTETLLESELFGHERGSFTGATQSKQGLLEIAEGGVIFLDEVGELHASTQAKLLRVLDERKLLRVGGLTPRSIDVRIVSATNRDLEAEVARGTFRLDLLYRLNAMSIIIPPLRERPNEIVALAQRFLDEIARKLQRSIPQISADALALLRSYSWPGNVRELRNMMERAVVLSTSDEIGVIDLPEEKMRMTFEASRQFWDTPAPMPAASSNGSWERTPPGGTMALPTPGRPSSNGWERPTGPLPRVAAPEGGDADDERQKVVDALESCAGNQTHAAKLLGVSRRTLINKIEKYGVLRPRKR
ncbi:MAG: sigma 54-interacting transcriptional regulator [Deltaproteobacteria bacterium]|nr:sigma 54-interacting transcriptional regulator [Deltaproteobacteria bacterium]